MFFLSLLGFSRAGGRGSREKNWGPMGTPWAPGFRAKARNSAKMHQNPKFGENCKTQKKIEKIVNIWDLRRTSLGPLWKAYLQAKRVAGTRFERKKINFLHVGYFFEVFCLF
jgi:hypothetical protein